MTQTATHWSLYNPVYCCLQLVMFPSYFLVVSLKIGHQGTTDLNKFFLFSFFFFCRSAKKTVPDVYVGNLAVADLVHVTVMPFLIHQWARGGHWVFGSTLCTIITSLDNCNQVACAAVMTAMSLDRFVISEITMSSLSCGSNHEIMK